MSAQVGAATRNLRKGWLRVHRYLALSVGWILALVALMGAMLVTVQPLDRKLHTALFEALSGDIAPAARAPIEPVRQRLLAEFGNKTTLQFRLPREPRETLSVTVRANNWSGTVFLDPADGKEQGRRGETEGLANLLFKLHSTLGFQDTGKAALAWLALVYLFMLITGLILWWPRRWPPSWRVAFDKGTVRALFDLHRVGGAIFGLLIAMSVASGAYMAWRPLNEFVSTLAGVKALKPPAVPKGGNGPAVTVDALIAQAQAQFPNDRVSLVQLPGEPNRPVRVRMLVADDPHTNGLTSVWLHPRTGEVLSVRRWNELDPGARAVAYVYPLHTGKLGGLPLEIMVSLNGLMLGSLGISGIWLWWRRRRSRRQPAPRALTSPS